MQEIEFKNMQSLSPLDGWQHALFEPIGYCGLQCVGPQIQCKPS